MSVNKKISALFGAAMAASVVAAPANAQDLKVASADTGATVVALEDGEFTAKYTLWHGNQVDEWDLEGVVDDVKNNVVSDLDVRSGYEIPQCVALIGKGGVLLDVFSADDLMGGVGANIQARERGETPSDYLSGKCKTGVEIALADPA